MFSINTSKPNNVDDILKNTLATTLDSSPKDPTSITQLGTLLSKIPIDPKSAKIIIVAAKYGLMHFAIMMVACMSVQEIFDESKF